MSTELLVRRRDRTHAIVEGALLGDIAIVFLLMRVFLPVPVVRTLLRTLASVPFVMLAQRRGIRLTILAAIASYILFSALVGPLLALTAVDVAVSGILIGIGRKLGLGAGLNTLWSGVAYAFLDLIIPTIATVIIFRYPVSDLVKTGQHFVKLLFDLVTGVMKSIGAPASAIREVHGWEAGAVAHWQIAWICLMIFIGILNMYLVALVSEMVLKQIPEETLARQSAA
ncbi:MAG TPA: hypothetical protein VF221_14865 [Chloroflexota bacterium]